MIETIIAIAIIVGAAAYLFRVYTRKGHKPCDPACGACQSCDQFASLTHDAPDCCQAETRDSDKA